MALLEASGFDGLADLPRRVRGDNVHASEPVSNMRPCSSADVQVQGGYNGQENGKRVSLNSGSLCRGRQNAN